MEEVKCPVCGADLKETGVIRYETYHCEWREDDQYFSDGLFDQTLFLCPVCDELITDFIIDNRLS